MKVSVIVPVKNRRNLILRCLDSILNQEKIPDELIVVDNDSNDGTYENVDKWMESHKNISIQFKLLKETSPGAVKARQRGLENAVGDYVIFFDSDDSMRPNLISTAFKELTKEPSLDIFCWRSVIHQLDGAERVPPFIVEKPIEGHLIHTLLRPQGYVIRKVFLNEARGWMIDAKVWNDYELGLRLLLRNPKIKGTKKILADIYAQEVSITGTNFSSKEGEWEAILRMMEKEVLNSTHPQKKKIIKILNYRKAILAALYYREGNIIGAHNLLKESLEEKSFKEKFLNKFSYEFTRRGLRGAWRIVRYFY